LENGYNVGVYHKRIRTTHLITRAKQKPTILSKTKSQSGHPKVTIISTGGTITSKVDYKTGAVSPLTRPEDLIANVPELAKLADIKILAPFSKFSEDLTPQDWQKIADSVAHELNNGAQGVVVTHGTDTLHYTAAALSFMLKDLSKPVALVGGQRSSDRGSFDGHQNLICAVQYALSNIAEVAVVMHANSDDDICYAIRGTKVRKMHSSRRDAFRPINCSAFAEIHPQDGVKVTDKKTNRRSNSKVVLANQLEPKVALIKYSPGLHADVLDYYVDKGYKGIILEGTGFGHVAEDWKPHIERAVKHAVICMTTQTIYGATNPKVYSKGRQLEEAGVVFCNDTLAETAYIKLMILLKRTKNLEDVKKMMTENLAGEINNRIEKKSFLY